MHEIEGLNASGRHAARGRVVLPPTPPPRLPPRPERMEGIIHEIEGLNAGRHVDLDTGRRASVTTGQEKGDVREGTLVPRGRTWGKEEEPE